MRLLSPFTKRVKLYFYSENDYKKTLFGLRRELLARIDAMNAPGLTPTHGPWQDPTSLALPKRNWKLIPCPWGLGHCAAARCARRRVNHPHT